MTQHLCRFLIRMFRSCWACKYQPSSILISAGNNSWLQLLVKIFFRKIRNIFKEKLEIFLRKIRILFFRNISTWFLFLSCFTYNSIGVWQIWQMMLQTLQFWIQFYLWVLNSICLSWVTKIGHNGGQCCYH